MAPLHHRAWCESGRLQLHRNVLQLTAPSFIGGGTIPCRARTAIFPTAQKCLDKPGRFKRLTDITEFQIPAGKVYLSPIIDCFDGMVVSWTIGTSPDAELVNAMLDAAIETVAETTDRPIVHSDRGGHYRWPGWLSRMSEANLTRSMSRKACSPDNAACEGFFGRLKNELFYPGD
jgi:transposase InsO family protein